MRVQVEIALAGYPGQLGGFVKNMEQYRRMRAVAGLAETAATARAFDEAAVALRLRTPLRVRVPPNQRGAREVTALEQAKRVCVFLPPIIFCRAFLFQFFF